MARERLVVEGQPRAAQQGERGAGVDRAVVRVAGRERAHGSSISIGSQLTSSDGAGTSLLTCWKATWIGVSPVNGCRPVSISNSRMPQA